MAIDIALGASRHLTAALAGLYGSAAAGCLWALRPWWLGALGAGAALGWGGYEARLHGLRKAGRAPVRLHAGTEGEWMLTQRNGHLADGLALDLRASFSHPALVVVALRRGWRLRWVPVPADATSPSAHRALRIRLRARA